MNTIGLKTLLWPWTWRTNIWIVIQLWTWTLSHLVHTWSEIQIPIRKEFITSDRNWAFLDPWSYLRMTTVVYDSSLSKRWMPGPVWGVVFWEPEYNARVKHQWTSKCYTWIWHGEAQETVQWEEFKSKLRRYSKQSQYKELSWEGV